MDQTSIPPPPQVGPPQRWLAGRRFFPGDIILEEKPVLSIPLSADADSVNDWLATISEEARLDICNLLKVDRFPAQDILDKIRFKSFETAIQIRQNGHSFLAFGVFRNEQRIRYSIEPNVARHWDESRQVLVYVATEAIEVDIPLTIRAMRQDQYARWRTVKHLERGALVLEERPMLIAQYDGDTVAFQMGTGPTEKGEARIYHSLPQLARFYQSCSPNVHAHWNSTTRSMECRTVEDIPADTRLSISFDVKNILLPRNQRHKLLRSNHEIDCDCDTRESSADSDERRASVQEAVLKGAEDIETIERALENLRVEKIYLYRDTLLYDGYQCLAKARNSEAISWLLRAYDEAKILVGSNDIRVRSLEWKLVSFDDVRPEKGSYDSVSIPRNSTESEIIVKQELDTPTASPLLPDSIVAEAEVSSTPPVGHENEIEALIEQGRSYLEQGIDGSAATCWRRVLDYQERVLGSQHPKLEEAIYSLAETSSRLGAYDEALSYLSRVVNLRKRMLGDSHQDTIQALFLRGMTLFKQDKFSEAEICWKEIRGQVMNDEVDDNICLTMHWLGMALYRQEKFDEAEKMWMDEVHVRQKWRDGPLSETLVAMRWLGEACLKQDRLLDAKLWWGKELEGWKLLQEGVGMEIPDAIHRLGRACFDHAELKEAEEWWEKQIAYLDDLHGNEYPHTNALDTMKSLGEIAFLQLQHDKAIYWWRREVDGRAVVFGLSEAESLEALFRLGRAYFEGGKLAEAETQWDRAVQARPDGEKFGDDVSTTQILYWLGRVCFERGQYEDAYRHWSRELKLQEEMHERRSRSVLDARSRVARASFERGWKENAVEMWKEEVELRLEYYGEACKETLSAMESLSHGYCELGLYIEAAEWCETSMKVRRDINDSDGVEQLDNLHLMGRIHFKEGRLKDAERIWGEELKKREEVHPEHRGVVRVLYKRSKLYLQTNRISEAEVDIRRALEIQSIFPEAKDPTLQECQALLHVIGGVGSSNNTTHVEESNQVTGYLDASTSHESSSKNTENPRTLLLKPSLSASSTAMTPQTPPDSLLVETAFNPSLALQPPLPSVRRFQELGELIASGIIFLISMCAFISSLFGYWMFS